MRSVLEQSSLVLGRPRALAAAAAVGAGLLALLAAGPSGAAAAALGALAACWLFFAALAAGAIALSATARAAQGRWADPIAPALESAAAWFPAAWVLLAALLAGAPAWMPALDGPHRPHWLALALRDLAAAGALFLVGTRFARASRDGRWEPRTGRLAVAYLATYVLALSLLTIDLVMSLGSGEPSAIVPAHSFIAGLLSAIAWGALLVPADAAEDRLRHDLGKLLFGFSAFWAYFVWCSFLPVWYANLPSETGEVLDRLVGGWQLASFGILGACFVLPFTLLLPERVKKHPALLGLASASVLLGLGAERFLLVLRPLRLAAAPANLACSLAVAAATTGLFALLVAARMPPRAGGALGAASD